MSVPNQCKATVQETGARCCQSRTKGSLFCYQHTKQQLWGGRVRYYDGICTGIELADDAVNYTNSTDILNHVHAQLLQLACTLPGTHRLERTEVARFAYYNALRVVRRVAGMPDLPPFDQWVPHSGGR